MKKDFTRRGGDAEHVRCVARFPNLEPDLNGALRAPKNVLNIEFAGKGPGASATPHLRVNTFFAAASMPVQE
jgi:hypothetical protein